MFHQPRVVVEHTVAEDTEAERHRVYSAFDKMRDQIDRMMSQAEFGAGGEHQDILATYKMFAYDEGWSRRINAAIDSGLTAEAAIERVQPWGVDASSRLEESPGIKDHAKVRAYVEAARA